MSESFEAFCKEHGIPNTVTVNDAAFILNVRPAEVRKQCQDGTLRAIEVLAGSGKWRIEVDQLENQKRWSVYVEKRQEILQKSKQLAEFMVRELNKE